MKTRKEYINEIKSLIEDENYHDIENYVDNLIDDMEDEFEEISEKLKWVDINHLHAISDAQLIAEKASRDLY